MRAYRRFSSVQQMGVSVGAFVVLALMLESGGLMSWAGRLDIGPERTVAVPVAMFLHRMVGWAGMEGLRHREMVGLAKIGWSDDPAALAEAHPVKYAAAVVERPAGLPAGTNSAVIPTSTAVALPPTPKTPLRPMVGDPPLLSSLPELPLLEAGKVRTVALAGDSMMAVGLSSTLLRQAPQYKDLALVKAFKSGTGLARPEVFNWQVEYPAMLGDAHPDVVLVAIGANDGQGFVDDGVVYPFGTEAWKEIYQRRVQAYLEMLEAGGATVVWLGLPPMKSDVYDAHIALVNRIDYAVVSASPRAIWVSTAGLVGDADGRFQDFGEVHGQPERLRQGDGIHLSDEGAVLVVDKILPWLAAQGTTVPAVEARP
jgi:lysophospholipase L1-like esterase